jgi:hypothetical protein
MKCRTTAGSLPRWVAGEEKQPSYVAAVLQPVATHENAVYYSVAMSRYYWLPRKWHC